jgi:hypothetical protein
MFHLTTVGIVKVFLQLDNSITYLTLNHCDLSQQANAASATSTANTTNSKSSSIMMAASTADVV